MSTDTQSPVAEFTPTPNPTPALVAPVTLVENVVEALSAEAESNKPSATTSFQAELAEYLPEAEKLPLDQVLMCRADPRHVGKNVRLGVAVVSEPSVRARVEAAFKDVDWGPILDLPRLADTFEFVSRKSEEKPVAIRRVVKEATVVRSVLFAQMEVLVKTGRYPAEELKRLRAGKGPIDLAADLLDVAAYLEAEAPNLRGKLAIDDEVLQNAKRLGDELKAIVRPANFRRQEKKRGRQATQRDRIWTLLFQRHTELRRIAAWLWLEEATAKVPTLTANRQVAKGSKGEEKAPEAPTAVPVS